MARDGWWWAVVVLLTGCGATPSVPGTATSATRAVVVHGPDDVAAVLAGGRVTRDLVFDGGRLRLEPPPPSAHPDPGETDAIALVRSHSPVGSAAPVTTALVGLARATLRLPVTFPPSVAASPPRLADQLVWMVLTTGDPHSCPAMTRTPTDTTDTIDGTDGAASPSSLPPEPLHVDLVAADGSGLGVAYATAGSFCDRPVPVTAGPLTYHLSLPWRIVSATTRTLTVTADVPPCALAEGGTMAADLRRGTSTLGIDAVVFMAPTGCRTSGPGSGPSITRSVDRTGPALPIPEPTGLNPTGMIDATTMKDFTSNDGTTHTIP